uniref:Uncharacterized protein n=1 Tax=Kangiella spongicola TaxID=796379 RepID=A0A318CZ72_9GAMM
MPQGDSSAGVFGVAFPLADETDGTELIGRKVGFRQGFCSGSSSSSTRRSSFSGFSSSSSSSSDSGSCLIGCCRRLSASCSIL